MDDSISCLFDDEIELERTPCSFKSKPIEVEIHSVHPQFQHAAFATSTILWGGARALSEQLLQHSSLIDGKLVLELGFVCSFLVFRGV